jgi:hypothetical protein
MSNTFTTSRTFTITHARYVTSKVAADLRQLHAFYGRPSEGAIDDYAEEAALLLRDGYLERVDYGFQRDDRWVLLLRYLARSDGTLTDENAGRVPAGVDIIGTSFSSYLTNTSRYFALSAAEREAVDAILPIRRSHGAESGFVSGTWAGDRSYSSGGTGVQRSIFRSL